MGNAASSLFSFSLKLNQEVPFQSYICRTARAALAAPRGAETH